MNKSTDNPLAEGLRQWVELCLLQIEEKKRKAEQKEQVVSEEKEVTEVET